MKPLAKDIWVWEQEQTFYGLHIGTRMTVIRLANDTLFIHSPIRLTEPLIKALDALGTVQHVVCPNKFHHLYAGDFKKQYPQARLYCAPGLDKKRPDISFDAVITNESTFPWNPELSHACIEGIPMVNEVVFYHATSRSLVITDLALHVRETPHMFTRFMLWLIGAYGRFGLSRLEKWVFIKDKKRFQQSLRPLFLWDFERIILAHGNLIESQGKQRFQEAFKNLSP